MNDSYLLERLVRTVRKYRQAQHAYGICPGDPKKDPIKRANGDEVRRWRDDVDILLAQIEKVHPVAEE